MSRLVRDAMQPTQSAGVARARHDGPMALPLAPPLDPMLSKSYPRSQRRRPNLRAEMGRVPGDRVQGRQGCPHRQPGPQAARALLPRASGALRTRTLPARCIVDGEVVIVREKGLDFDVLLQRIHPAESRHP